MKPCLAEVFSIILLLCIASVTSPAQTFTTLFNFDVTNGAGPVGALVQGTDGNYYGTTPEGGAYANCFPRNTTCGTVFKVTPSGTLTTLHSFDGTDGAAPVGALVLGTNGYFYGTTSDEGPDGGGTVFKITAAGVLTTLYDFNSAYPLDGLIRGTDGNFYGTTSQVAGSIFKITPSGALSTLTTFNGLDGGIPTAPLVQGTDGNFYGTTGILGAYGKGTAFKVTPTGTLDTLHSFDGTDGNAPNALVLAGGNFYGTTYDGGAKNDGTVFKMTSGGKLTTLHSFAGTDGSHPSAVLILATNGKLYGTTDYGSNPACAGGCGTVFEITTGGKLTTLHSFDHTDGNTPYAGLLQATNGTFYGTTQSGGADGVGTIFSLSVGLGPFVETTPTSGNVGAHVIILGNNLTGTTEVTFKGTPAQFTIVSGTLIKATVPTGATTGSIQVTTPNGTLVSNVAFYVE